MCPLYRGTSGGENREPTAGMALGVRRPSLDPTAATACMAGMALGVRSPAPRSSGPPSDSGESSDWGGWVRAWVSGCVSEWVRE